ncbi:DUF3830 family protein [Sphingomonas nostoxanthinifaciens]|uniref:DUF3830 family protein n=1 Tax=Sphingomonas nostoxanthinifaciens TaxID=2872652 RepID=UPI001CC216AE|nr:DUF3830 family protein [Sphingomonas nostoxanthinifaciens]UAK25132.1 DUF3830 family protein [Sphingomonas nostoxanthinifaciens]
MDASDGATTRLVRLSEPRSGLDVRVRLLDDLAPHNAELLWALAGLDAAHAGIHAMWTGPEISLPIAGDAVLPDRDLAAVPLENATSFPQAGDIALVCAKRGTWRDGPPFDLLDVGLFYASGGRLLMPMGWIMGSICARILDEDLDAAATACRAIRAQGGCQITIARAS